MYVPVRKISEIILHACDTWRVAMCIEHFRLNQATFKSIKKKPPSFNITTYIHLVSTCVVYTFAPGKKNNVRFPAYISMLRLFSL